MICQSVGRADRLPLARIPDPDRHRECPLVGAPAVGDRAGLVVERELQHRQVGAPQVLIEDRRQVLPQLAR